MSKLQTHLWISPTVTLGVHANYTFKPNAIGNRDIVLKANKYTVLFE